VPPAPLHRVPPVSADPQRRAARARAVRLALCGAASVLLTACQTPPRASAPARNTPPTAARRPFVLPAGAGWTGNGIGYGPHRAGQTPDGGPQPTRAQLLEDLRLMQRHWSMLRMYASTGAAETVAELIRAERLPLRLVVGAWIAPEDPQAPDSPARRANLAQISTAIRLANDYPDVVAAVTVGNETQVFWSSHKVAPDVLIGYLRTVRAQTRVPVSTADDFRFWATPESKTFADEVDFVMVHVYAMWNGQTLDNALAFTQAQFAAVAAAQPGVPLVLGEAGWATGKSAFGEQATLIHGAAGEAEQRAFHAQFTRWTTAERIPNFFFEAFDEPWKGGPDPTEVEKHWGLFNVDRTPKPALQP
jgi:exo-beta-1,3-glucanase (GH17 family)